MRKFFIVLTSLFATLWLGPVIFSIISSLREGVSVDRGDLVFLIFGVVFLFVVFSKLVGGKQTNTQKNTLLSKKEKQKLQLTGNKISTRFLKLDFDVIETKDPRAAYFVVQDKPFGREYKTIVLLNNKEIKNLLEGKEFFVYLDVKNPDKYFIDFSNLAEEISKGGMYLPLA